MANKKLKTIQFPGLPDTYTVPQVENGANNNVAILDGAGNVKDSNTALNKVANKEYVDGRTWIPKSASMTLFNIPSTAEKLTNNSTGTDLYRMTKENFLAANISFSLECYDRILAKGLVIQNYGGGADFTNNLAIYAPAFVKTGMRNDPAIFTNDMIYNRMKEHDIMLAFFPNYETGHETDIYFINYANIADFIIY